MEVDSTPRALASTGAFMAGLRGLTRGHADRECDELEILVVDDEPADAQMIIELLTAEDAGLLVPEVAGSIAAAERWLSMRTFSIVLLDLGLPDADGVEGVQALVRVAPQVPIVVVSGNEDEVLALKAIEHGAQDYLVKGRFDPDHLVHSLRYAIERSKLLRRIDLSQRRLQTIVDHAADGIVVLDESHTVKFANDRAIGFLNARATGLVGRPFGLPVAAGACKEIELTPSGASPHDRAVAQVSASEIEWDGRSALLVSIHDSTKTRRLTEALEKSNRRLQQVALLDPLTATYNRRGFGRAMESELAKARRSDEPIMALLVDCDDFKLVNDVHGHAVGDAVLRYIARRVQESCRCYDVVARIGGDEFLVLLPQTDLPTAVAVGERIRLAVSAREIPEASAGPAVTVSVGVAALPHTTASVSEVLALAHTSLKTSKQSGKNRVTCAELPPAGNRFERWLASSEFHHDLSVAWQPIVRVSDETVVGHELLVRGPSEIVESPTELFGLARENGLLQKLDMACLIACLRAADRFEVSGRLHVNIFPSVLIDVQIRMLIDLVRRLDADSGVAICLEINEQEYIEDLAPLRERIQVLKSEGIRVALDDVGTGFGTLDTVIGLGLDQVKLDRCMIHGASSDTGLALRLERTVRSMKALGTELVAEGVEDRADLEVAKRLGIDHAQGFLWSKPVAGPYVIGRFPDPGSGAGPRLRAIA